MLAMDLDQKRRDLTEQCGGGRLAVDEAPAAAIGLDLASHDQRLARLHRDTRLVQNGGQAAIGGGGLETGGDDRLTRAMTDQSAVAAPAQRQPQRVEQDRFARPGLARQDTQAPAEIKIQRLDQHDIANGQCGQHGGRYKAKCRAMLSPRCENDPDLFGVSVMASVSTPSRASDAGPWMASLCSPHDKKGDQPVGELLLPVGVGRPGAAALGVTVPPLPGRPILTEPGVPVGTTGWPGWIAGIGCTGYSRISL